jgi:hypothetical protein
MKYKVLADFIYEDGRIHAGQIVELPTDKAQHLIGSGKICPAGETEAVVIETAIVEPPENTMLHKRNKYAGK